VTKNNTTQHSECKLPETRFSQKNQLPGVSTPQKEITSYAPGSKTEVNQVSWAKYQGSSITCQVSRLTALHIMYYALRFTYLVNSQHQWYNPAPGRKEISMSLNLRYMPRRRNRRGQIVSLLGIALFLTSLAAWQRGWQLEQTLAQLNLNQELVKPYLPIDLPPLPALQPQPAEPAQSDAVIMVNSKVLENPQSVAYTADLYGSTGKDVIPWPNIAGRTEIEIYTVQSGDSLWSIAAQFELDLDTLRWSNPELERNPDVLSVGTQLRILPVPGVYHLVAPGDTIETIAVQYGVAPTDITNYPPNALYQPYNLERVEGLIIPYGRKDINIPKPSLSLGSLLAWPIVGVVTGGFEPDHPALDIGAPYGSTVYAADAGLITYADWGYDGLGYTVIIDHGSGRETWYVHLKGALLSAGNAVNRGDPVGAVGSTGHSTGPHLHFELHLNGERVNPLGYLPGTPQ
jgi:murein DD-endopeptidase MepM/ murein hydrolase activator NlpD